MWLKFPLLNSSPSRKLYVDIRYDLVLVVSDWLGLQGELGSRIWVQGCPEPFDIAVERRKVLEAIDIAAEGQK